MLISEIFIALFIAAYFAVVFLAKQLVRYQPELLQRIPDPLGSRITEPLRYKWWLAAYAALIFVQFLMLK